MRKTRAAGRLWWAAENGREAVVNMLLDTGKVDLDAKDETGQTYYC
jgi:ankyrin repeat protein